MDDGSLVRPIAGMDMKLEVRCCCDPMKLMGWIPVPYEGQNIPRSIRIPLLMERARPIAGLATQNSDIVMLVERFAYGEAARALAFKADGIPVETLRRIQGFVEATPENLAIEIRLQKRDLLRSGREVPEIRVHPSIMMELRLIPLERSPVHLIGSGWALDGTPLIQDVKEASFKVCSR